MKYHYQKSLQVGWSLWWFINGVAITGWLLLLAIFIDMMLFDGRLLTNLLTL